MPTQRDLTRGAAASPQDQARLAAGCLRRTEEARQADGGPLCGCIGIHIVQDTARLERLAIASTNEGATVDPLRLT